MTETLYKYVNKLDARGRPVRDPKTRKLVSERVAMTPEEAEAFEAERAALAPPP